MGWTVEIQKFSPAHRELHRKIYTHPEMMKDMNGPMNPEALQKSFERMRDLSDYKTRGDFVITLQPGKIPVGIVAFVQTEFEGEKYFELGWMVLPEFQNKGVASQGARLLLNFMKEEKLEPLPLIAFTAGTKNASERICQKLNLEYVKPVVRKYFECEFPCHQWASKRA